MRRLLPFALAAVGLLALAATGWQLTGHASAAGPCDAADADLDASEQQMLQLVNGARAAQGLGALVPSATLNRAAAWKSGDPSAGSGGFSHTDSLGRNPFVRMADCGYVGGGGENIAVGTSDAATIFGMWMESPGHRQAILTPSFKAIGIGRRTVYWTMDFGYNIESGGGTAPQPATTVPPTSTPIAPSPTATATAIPTQTPRPVFRLVLPMLGSTAD